MAVSKSRPEMMEDVGAGKEVMGEENQDLYCYLVSWSITAAILKFMPLGS